MRLKFMVAVALPALLNAQAPKVQEAPLRAHLAFLSDDLLEGRGTGQRGSDLTMRYLETQLAAMGLEPGNGGSFRQTAKIAGVKTNAAESTFKFASAGSGKAELPLSFGDQIVFSSGSAKADMAFDAPMVFVGYGIAAPEESWDDYKNADCRGKVLVMLVNDPQPTAEEPDRFGGKSLTYYGRWTYKFEEGLRRGAAGVLLIHTDASASYGWSVVKNGWAHERFQLAEGAGATDVEGWLTHEAAKALFAAAGQDLGQLAAKAERKDFRPVDLGLKATGHVVCSVRLVEQGNIAGVVPGTDPELKDEVVIYSAHWDHLGKGEGAGDQTWNGSVDNASGTAAVLAMAKAAVERPAKRSQMFLLVFGEEQGLLGSKAYARHPLWPLMKTAADLNLDSMNFVGATRDIGTQGSERTTLGATAAGVAHKMGLAVAKVEPDLGGGYFRSDHFSFANVGVPAFSINSGKVFVQHQEASRSKAAAYSQRYHQVTDEFDPAWDLSGMVQQAQFTLNLGYAVANAPQMPVWKKGDPLGQVRQAAGSKAAR
ncbi:MAG: M28 family peptidase [Holophagaceae bacterium]|nr:M28 family peptidase [Holophagaceae bacterium]